MANDSAKPIKKADSDRSQPIDILADYRYWRSKQEDRIGTHSPECHVWPRHERCMIHRLAREVERLRTIMYRIVDEDCTVAIQSGTFYADDEPLFSVERTPPTQPTPGECSTQEQGTCPPSR